MYHHGELRCERHAGHTDQSPLSTARSGSFTARLGRHGTGLSPLALGRIPPKMPRGLRPGECEHKAVEPSMPSLINPDMMEIFVKLDVSAIH